MPKFQNMVVWQQAEVLMQPAFIRLIANIDKQLEKSDWKGHYQDVQNWAEGVSDETKARVLQLRSQLETADVEHIDAIEEALAQLPTPYPGYQLCLARGDRQICVDLWDLCYQICFQNYDTTSGTSLGHSQSATQGVEVDTSLFDETGEVDWDRLDYKTRQLVEHVFTHLSAGEV